MSKKVLITGAAGFIGSNLSYYLHKHRPEWQLYLLDALTYAGNLENIAPLIDEQEAEFLKCNIVDAEAVNQIFEKHKFDYVMHLAAESHVDRSIHSAAEFVLTNVVGTQNLVDAARNSNIGRFLHISTDEVYGALGAEGRFYETTPLDPTSPYSASKAASDLLVLANHKTHGFNAVVTRCTNNYGPYHFPEKLIPLFITNALENKKLPVYGDGMQVRHWIYVEDHCAALLKVLESGRAGEIYNIGGLESAELPNLEVTKNILNLLNKPETLITRVEDRLAHDRRYAVDTSKMQTELGWQPKVDFKTGLQKTIDWYLANKSWWQNVKSGEYQKYYAMHYGEN